LLAHEKSNRRKTIAGIAFILFWVFGILTLATLLRGRPGWPLHGPYQIAWYAGFVLLLFMNPRWNRWYMRKINLACPYCGDPFIGSAARVAVASGRCGRCGNPVVNDA